MERVYAQAVASQLAKGAREEDLVSSLVAHLTQEGRMKLLPAILRELRTLSARKSTLGSVVEVASDAEAKDALSAAGAQGIDAEKAVVNPSLITGWRARSGSTLVDRSGKRALIDLYRRITA